MLPCSQCRGGPGKLRRYHKYLHHFTWPTIMRTNQTNNNAHGTSTKYDNIIYTGTNPGSLVIVHENEFLRDARALTCWTTWFVYILVNAHFHPLSAMSDINSIEIKRAKKEAEDHLPDYFDWLPTELIELVVTCGPLELRDYSRLTRVSKKFKVIVDRLWKGHAQKRY